MKETRKQIVEQTRNEVAKAYNKRVKELEIVNARLSNENFNLSKENRILKSKNLELEDKVNSLNDWIERLQEFVALPEDARQQYIAKFNAEKQLNEAMGVYTRMFDRLFHF